MAAAALIGMVGGMATNYWNNEVSRDNANVAFERQKQLMRLQQQYNQENYYAVNAYNTPEAQKQRLKAAGINPNIMYGNGGVGNMAEPMPAASAPSVSPAQTVPMSNPVSDAIEALQGIALAKKTKEEGIGQKIENDYNLQSMEERIRAIALQNNWTEEQTAKISHEIANIVGQNNILQGQLDNLRKEGKLLDKQEQWFDRRMTAEINDLKASKRYKDAQSNLTDTERKQMDALFDSMKRISNANADFLENSVNLIKKYGDAQAIIGMLSQVVSSATEVLSWFRPKLPNSINIFNPGTGNK